LHGGEPWHAREDGESRPDERGENEQNVGGGEIVIFQFELKICERKIENEVEGKWQSDERGDCRLSGRDSGTGEKISGNELVKHHAKRDGDEHVQKCPNRTEKPSRWRPTGLFEKRVGLVGFHFIFYFEFINDVERVK